MDSMFANPVVLGFFLVALYIFFGFCLFKLGQRLGDKLAWWAWVPLLQVLLMIRLAELRYWWFILLLIPFVNIAAGIYIWIRIAARRSKPWWMGALMVVPGVDLFVLAHLSLSKN